MSLPIGIKFISVNNEESTVIFYSLVILIGLSVFLFALMIAFRLAYIRDYKYRRKKDVVWEPIILGYLSEEIGIEHAIKLLKIRERDRLYFTNFINEYLTALAGDEYNKLIVLFRAMDFTAWEIKRSHRRNLWERVFALNELGYLKDRAAIPHLRANLHDSSELISYAAAQSLSAIGDMESFMEVLIILLKGARWNRIRSAEIILEFGRQSAPQLTLFLDDPEVSNVRKSLIIDVLSEFKYEEIAGKLINLARKTEDANLKISIIKYLGEISYLDGESFLLESLYDPNWIIRSQSARSLGLIGDPSVSDRLMPILRDPVWWVRYHAARAIGISGFEGMANLARLQETETDKYAGEMCRHVLSELEFGADDESAVA